MNLEEEIRRDANNAIRNSKPMFDMIDKIFFGARSDSPRNGNKLKQMTTVAHSRIEQLFYEIAHAQDSFSLTFATLKITAVAQLGSPEYDELIKLSASKRIELEQSNLNQRN